MRILIVLFFLFFSCSQSNKQIDAKIEKYKIDTLMIDSGSDIIYLKENLTYSGLAIDQKKLFNIDIEQLKLQIIDLETARLEKEVLLEREGPNGIGDWFIGFKVWDDSTFVLLGDNRFYKVDLEGNLKEKIGFDHLFYVHEELAKRFGHTGFKIHQNKIYNVITTFGKPEFNLLIYDFKEDIYDLKEIPGSENLISSTVITYLGKSNFTDVTGFSIVDFSDDFILHNRSYPQMAVYRTNSNSIQLINSRSNFYEDVPKVDKVKEVYSENESKEFKKELEKRMSFLIPLWDEENQRIFRWGYKLSVKNVEMENPEYDNYFFVMDKEFNIVEEFLIPEVRIKPYRIFFIDNKIYLYHNFEDELGFIRGGLDFLKTGP